MSRLVTCAEEDKEASFTEIVQEIKSMHHKDEESFKFRLCLVKFTHRIWVEGIYHMKLHPMIVIPTNVYERYHKANQELEPLTTNIRKVSQINNGCYKCLACSSRCPFISVPDCAP